MRKFFKLGLTALVFFITLNSFATDTICFDSTSGDVWIQYTYFGASGGNQTTWYNGNEVYNQDLSKPIFDDRVATSKANTTGYTQVNCDTGLPVAFNYQANDIQVASFNPLPLITALISALQFEVFPPHQDACFVMDDGINIMMIQYDRTYVYPDVDATYSKTRWRSKNGGPFIKLQEITAFTEAEWQSAINYEISNGDHDTWYSTLCAF